jgi:hypothetical protein
MKIARHWIRETARTLDAKGREVYASAWGWSETNVDEARRRALESAKRVVDWLRDHADLPAPPKSAQYAYCTDRPPREEIVEELRDAAGATSALITRNSYGSLVLNCRDLAFVDVDVPPSAMASVRRLLGSLFGKRQPGPSTEDGVLERVRQWCAEHRDVGVRLYRTAAGFRLAVVDRVMQANSPAARQMLEELGADPLYRRLCEVQECFRARLSPKPWRIDMGAPPGRFPFADAAAEERYRAWQRNYEAAAPAYATCRFVESHGPTAVHEDLAPLVNLHDSLTACQSELPLA